MTDRQITVNAEVEPRQKWTLAADGEPSKTIQRGKQAPACPRPETVDKPGSGWGLRKRSSPSATADLRSSETVQRIHPSSGHHPEPRSRRRTAHCTWSTRAMVHFLAVRAISPGT